MLARFRADPIAFLRQTADTDAPLAEFRLGRRTLWLLTDPALIEEALVTRQSSFRKGPGLLRARPLLGDGLLTADGADHWAHRRQLQPAFRGARIAAYAGAMARHADEAAGEWRDGETRDIHRDMLRLTLRVVGTTLFASRQPADPEAVAEGMAEALQALYRPLSRCPHARAEAGRAQNLLGGALDTLIGGHAPGPDADDLLSLLQASARTPDACQAEALTFLLAGHESVANALTWTWHALSRHESVRARFEAEIDAAGDPAGDGPGPALPYTHQVIAEALRLYPPAWMVSREALEDVTLVGRPCPAGTVVIAAPCVTHTAPRYWPDPARFDPDRWADSAQAAHPRPRFAYFPFGGGSRRCIGEQFALTEMAAVLRAVGRRWRLLPPPGAADPLPEPLVTLRPAGGLPLVLTARP